MYFNCVMYDYGETLIHEKKFDPKAGTIAILNYCHIPFDDIFIDEIQEFAVEYSKTQRSYSHPLFKDYIEITNVQFQRAIYRYFDLDVKLSDYELQKIFWDACAPYEKTEFADELLNIPSQKKGVVSNLAFSGDVLKDRLESIFETHFDFVLSSSDVGIRKPNPFIFNYAKRISKAENILFVGDTYESDIVGAKQANFHYLNVNLLKNATWEEVVDHEEK